MIDLLIAGATVVTVDAERRVIDDGAVAVDGGRILAVGSTGELSQRHQARRTLDARRKVVMPGLIDGHGHAGHGLVKTLGGDDGEQWFRACEAIYAGASSRDFWHAEALLTTLERLKAGTTTGVSLLGGGDSVMRTDDPLYADRHMQAVEQVGIRTVLAVGPRRPPFPRSYVNWEQGRRELTVSFADQLAVCEETIRHWHGRHGRLHVCLVLPVVHPERHVHGAAELAELQQQAAAVRELLERHGVLFHQDGHTRGTIRYLHDRFGLTGARSFFSHSTRLTDDEITLCADTDSRIVHNPSAVASILGRCPVTELIDAGVTVMLGSDGTAPDRSYDMFRHIFQCMRYHRYHFHDSDVLPPGKVLEMATIDAARGLGLDHEIGSLETGKQADIILLDMAKPHLYPLNMPLYRALYFANGADVDTVIVSGRILMENRRVTTVDEAGVLEFAQQETETMLERSGLHHLLETREGFWGRTHY